MLLGLYADPHFSQTSSIIVGRKGDFSGRLDNLINSFTWMNKVFQDKGVDMVVCLGDLTDKPVLTSEEITAMSKCGIEEHYLIVGNHCRSDKDGKINSLAIYGDKVISSPRWLTDEVFVLPYNHSTFDFASLDHKPKIILSHNDIKGYDFGGGHLSDAGYDLNTILTNCELFINGHLHTGGWMINDKIMNLGNLSGINFSSCGGQWEPSIAILDTDTLKVELIENPCAYIFLKKTFDTIPLVKGFLDNLRSDRHYVIQLKVPTAIAPSVRQLVSQYDTKISASRIITFNDKKKAEVPEEKPQIELDKTSIYEKLGTFIENQKPKYSILTIREIIDTIAVEDK